MDFLRILLLGILCTNQHLESVIRQRIPSIIALINKTIDELNAELDRIGRPIGGDAGVRSQPIMGDTFLNNEQEASFFSWYHYLNVF